MLKMWKGPEMEGNDVGVMTLFVCSDEEVPTKRVIKQLYDNPDVRRIYFGAGKQSFEGVTSWRELYDYAFSRSLDIVIEVPHYKLEDYVQQYDSLITTFIVSRYDMPYTYNNLQFKTDDGEAVKIFTVSSRTMLDTLKENNLFICDTMLVEEVF